jgi:hypothetical protein
MPILPEGRYAPPVHMIKLTATQEITALQVGASRRGAVGFKISVKSIARAKPARQACNLDASLSL